MRRNRRRWRAVAQFFLFSRTRFRADFLRPAQPRTYLHARPDSEEKHESRRADATYTDDSRVFAVSAVSAV